MTIKEFLDAIDSGVDLKILSKMLKDLSLEDRRTAGIRFQVIKAGVKKPIKQKSIKLEKQPLESHSRWPLGYGMEKYKNELLIRTSDKIIQITGTDLIIKVTNVIL